MSVISTAKMNMSVSCSAANASQNSSVMPSECENCIYCGTPLGVPFFAFSRFFGYAFYYFYYGFIKNAVPRILKLT